MLGKLRPRSLVALFILLTVAVAVPLAILTALTARWYVDSERARLTANAHATGARLVERLDRDLAEMKAIARTLASSPLLDQVDLSGFEAQARRIVEVKDAAVTLAELDGRQLVNTRAITGQLLPITPRPEIISRLIRTREPVVSDVLVSALTGRSIVGVSAPVIREGVIVKVVSAVVTIEQLERLITQAGIAEPYFAALVDGAGHIIGRTTFDAPVTEVGGPHQDADIISFKDHSNLSDWTIISGIDQSAMEAPLRRSLVLLGMLGAVLLGLGALAAWFSIRTAATAASRLAEAARAIGRGEAVTLAPNPIREANVVGRALNLASATLADQRRAIETSQVDLEARVEERSRELEASRALYRILAENIGDVVTMRPLGQDDLRYVSPSAKSMFGLDPQEMGARHLIEHVHPGDFEKIRDIDAALAAGQASASCLFRARRQDGRWIWIESVSTRTAEPGSEGAYVISVLRDVTARQSQAEELRMARDLAELAHAKAESANRAKSDFLAVMSHEIRTPLSTIKGFTELLAESDPSEQERARYVALIGEASSTMLTAIDDMLDVAKVESGDLALDPRPFRLESAIEAAVNFARPLAAHQGVSVKLAIAPVQRGADTATHVFGDERRLRQIVLNILTAVLRNQRGGRVTVSAARRRPGTDGERLALSVTASGGQVLQQNEAGLGVTIAQRLIGLMGGRLETNPDPGESLRYEFSLRLPRCEASDAEPGTKPAAAPRRPARLLVAEDHHVNQEIVRRMLERAGHVVDIVADGEEAVAAVQVGGYDMVLMDIQMPVLGGLGATRRIRALQHPCRHIPIVAMTANVLPEQVRSFREAGMDSHVPKPLDRERLGAVIDSLLASVIVVETVEGKAAPSIFDRASFDALIATMGQAAARTTLNGFIALLDAAHSDQTSKVVDAASIAVGARRLGFLDLAAAHERLAEAAPDAREAALVRCRIASELAHRVLDELTEGGRDAAAARVALL